MDTFSKTIRKDITSRLRVWDKNPSFPLITSDLKATHYAQVLGLLPVPVHLEKIMYGLVYEV